MADINRTQRAAVNAAPLESAEKAQGAAPPPPTSKREAQAAQKDSVTTFDGAADARPALRQAGAAGMSGAEVQVGDFSRLTGAALMKQLATDADSCWRLSGAEAQAFVGQLGMLGPDERKAAIAELMNPKNGKLLNALLDKVPAEDRGPLLQHLSEAGVFARRDAEAPLNLPLSPPAAPGLFRAPGDLPQSLRDAILAENRSMGAAYVTEHKAYVQRYCEAAGQSQSPAELRALGPFIGNADLIDVDAPPGRQSVTGKNHGLTQAAETVSDRISAFKHEMRAGTYGVTGHVGWSVSVSRYSHKEKTAKTFAPGYEDTKESTTNGVAPLVGMTNGGTKVKATFNETRTSDGQTRTHLDVEVKDNGVSFDMKDGKAELQGGKVKLGSLGAEFDNTGKLKATHGIAMVEVDPEKGTFKSGIEVKEKVELFGGLISLGVDGSLALTGQGVGRQYARAVGDPANAGFFGPLPELEAGTAWSELPEARRKALALHGWSEQHWAQALPHR